MLSGVARHPCVRSPTGEEYNYQITPHPIHVHAPPKVLPWKQLGHVPHLQNFYNEVECCRVEYSKMSGVVNDIIYTFMWPKVASNCPSVLPVILWGLPVTVKASHLLIVSIVNRLFSTTAVRLHHLQLNCQVFPIATAKSHFIPHFWVTWSRWEVVAEQVSPSGNALHMCMLVCLLGSTTHPSI